METGVVKANGHFFSGEENFKNIFDMKYSLNYF